MTAEQCMKFWQSRRSEVLDLSVRAVIIARETSCTDLYHSFPFPSVCLPVFLCEQHPNRRNIPKQSSASEEIDFYPRRKLEVLRVCLIWMSAVFRKILELWWCEPTLSLFLYFVVFLKCLNGRSPSLSHRLNRTLPLISKGDNSGDFRMEA